MNVSLRNSGRKLIAFAWLAVALALPITAQAVIVANFDGGNGNASSDQFPGSTGNGWATTWGTTGTGAGTGVSTTSPLNGGGNYLQVIPDTTSGTALVRRQYASSGEVNISQPYRISFSFRYDGPMSEFTTFNDRISLFGDGTSQTGTATSNTWLIGVAAGSSGAGTGQSVYPGNWYFFDNNGTGAGSFSTGNMYNTGIALQTGVVYNFVVDINPTAGTYSAFMDDGVNQASASDLKFRSGGTSTSSWLHFSTVRSANTETPSFSIDNVAISVPEPSVPVLMLLGALGALARRRR